MTCSTTGIAVPKYDIKFAELGSSFASIDVIAKVTEATAWVNPMILVQKPN